MGKVLLIIGIITLVLGFLLLIVGFLGVGNVISSGFGGMNGGDVQSASSSAIGGIGLFALGSFMLTGGFGLTAAGGIVMLVSHKREITAYSTQQVMPIAQEGIEKMAPTIGSAAGTIGKELAKGIKEGINEADNK